MMGGRTLTAGFIITGCLVGCSSSGSPTVQGVATTSTVATASAVATTTAVTTATPISEDTAPVTPDIADTAPTEPPDTRPINTDDQTRAVAGMMHEDDFKSPWTVYAPSAQVARISEDSCAFRPNGAVTQINRGGAQAGATLQLGTTGAFVSSYVFVFPTEALAKEYIDLINSDEWAECRRAEMQQFQDDHGIDSAVTLASRDDPSLHQSGFESYTLYTIADSSGKIRRNVTFSLYQIDRTVIGFTQEYGQLSDADSKTYFDDSYAALLAAYNRVKAL